MSVEILIVTLCLAERGAAVRRAIDSTLSQDGVDASVIVVVNGPRYDHDLFDALRRMPRVHVHYQPEPSIFLARRRAREQVTAPLFGFLDDDDYLLPDALRARVLALTDDPSADAVVANGELSHANGVSPMLSSIAEIRADPLQSLMRSNWLATASALFRTASVPPDWFDTTIRSSDMTYLAFHLARAKKIVFIDTPTYRKTYSPDSISLTDDWALSALATLDKMRAFDVPAPVRRQLRRKCARAAHQIADIYRKRGDMRMARRYHFRSLADPWGLVAYALYTRRLLGSGMSREPRSRSAGPSSVRGQ